MIVTKIRLARLQQKCAEAAEDAKAAKAESKRLKEQLESNGGVDGGGASGEGAGERGQTSTDVPALGSARGDAARVLALEEQVRAHVCACAHENLCKRVCAYVLCVHT